MANNLEIVHNQELNRWELHFLKAPEEDLSDYLERLGYRYSPRKPRLYYAPKHDAYKLFAEDLKDALLKNKSHTEIIIKPSYIPHASNIVHNKFSYVTISHETEKSVQKKNFVIFDQYKKIAEAIAWQYGERIYGKRLKSVEATPRVEKKKAKKLFEKNVVINPSETIEGDAPKKEEKKKSLTNDSGVYTKEAAGDRLEVIKIPIPETAKYDAIIKIIHDENDKYRFATSMHKNFGDHSGGSSPVSNTSDIYQTKQEVLILAFQEIISGIKLHIEKRDDIISDQDKKNRLLNKALTTTLEFAKGFGIDLGANTKENKANSKERNTKTEKKTKPKEEKEVGSENNSKPTTKEITKNQIENIEIPIPEDAKYKATQTENNQVKKSSTLKDLKNLVSSISQQLQDLADRADTIGNKALIETERIQFNDSLEIKEHSALIKALKRILTEQEFWIKKIKTAAIKEQYVSILNQLTIALDLPMLEVLTSSEYVIIQKWTTLKENILNRFQELVDTNPDALHFTYLPSATGKTNPSNLTILRVEIVSDRDAISFLHRRGTNELVINNLNEYGTTMAAHNGSEIPMGKLKSAISYMISYPETLQIKPYTIAAYKNLYKAQKRDIESNGVKIPNVLIPKGVVNTIFEVGNVQKEKAAEYAKRFPKLFALTDKTLTTASAKQLFSLTQLYPLEDYGIDTDWNVLNSHLQLNGEDIFKALGYPTDRNYPFVHVNTGYSNIATLGNILNSASGKNQWLSVVESYRPIADMDKAIIILDEKIEGLITKRTEYIDSETGTAKRTSPEGEIYNSLFNQIQNLREYIDTINTYQGFQISTSRNFIKQNEINKAEKQVSYRERKEELQTEQDHKKGKNIPDVTVIDPVMVTAPETPRLISTQEAERIRRQFTTKGFTVSFTGKQAFTKSISIVELGLRYGYNQVKLDEKIEKEFNQWIGILETEIKALEGKEDRKSKQSKIHRLERISALKRESEDLEILVANEDKVFRDELFVELVGRAKDKGYVILSDRMADFRKYLMKHLFKGRIVENYPDRSIGKTVQILIDDYFSGDAKKLKEINALDYLDKVVAIMHDHYMEARRLPRKKIELIKDIADVPNLGMLWEAVELSWLLWYKFYYQEPVSFENRLDVMIRFWNEVQPTYAYSDSSKELYKQYSTPCLIGAMIAEYTEMPKAESVFEPSAGNGLLVLGADPKITHVNEIDSSRRKSLEFQGFKTITHLNAAEPFPKELTASFDVMVTNPPFASWDADNFDKKRIVDNYFNRYRRLDKNRLRLEHVMSGLALHTLKDSGKAALIIMGHLYFDDRGYIAKARPFFNWLYMHYRVDDVINLNGFTLYNKQGAVAKTMLILIGGRKRNPTNKSIAPTRKQAASLDVVIDTFEELWTRVKSHIKNPIELLIQKLKIENGYDIL
jgi:hypothetical protein